MGRLALFCLLLCFISCKTLKNNIRETYTENKEIVTDVREESTTKETVVVLDEKLTNEISSIVEKIITEKFTMPDSTGKQYVVERVMTEREINTQKAEVGNRKSESEATAQTVFTDNSKETDNIQGKIIDKSITKKKTPVWVTVSASIVSAGIMLFILFILKKYRMI